MMTQQFNWQWLHYNELDKDQLYALLQLRQQVFALEQGCVYCDLDNVDQHSWHLFATISETSQLAAYLRLTLLSSPEKVKLSRIVCAKAHRGLGLGQQLVTRAVAFAQQKFPDVVIMMSAQAYLENFYQALGFETVSAPYLDTGIEHIDMNYDQ